MAEVQRQKQSYGSKLKDVKISGAIIVDHKTGAQMFLPPNY